MTDEFCSCFTKGKIKITISRLRTNGTTLFCMLCGNKINPQTIEDMIDPYVMLIDFVNMCNKIKELTL